MSARCRCAINEQLALSCADKGPCTCCNRCSWVKNFYKWRPIEKEGASVGQTGLCIFATRNFGRFHASSDFFLFFLQICCFLTNSSYGISVYSTHVKATTRLIFIARLSHMFSLILS